MELILHAGDVGGDDILDELGLIAPVMAVYGNTDPTDHPRLSGAIRREVGGVSIHVSHGHEVGSPTPQRLLARFNPKAYRSYFLFTIQYLGFLLLGLMADRLLRDQLPVLPF